MRGHGTGHPDHASNKWSHVSRLMKDRKIGILALQETHLTDEYKDRILQYHGQRMHITHTANPTHPNAHGVAIVINKHLTRGDNITTWEIIPGRALLAGINWHRDEILYVMAIYAPNDPTENGAFWNRIQDAILSWNLPRPDVILGDFNITEHAQDRSPQHRDHEAATLALGDLCDTLGLRDGWRTTYPTKHAYTYAQPGLGSKSRIDRIYLTHTLLQTATEWTIGPSGEVDTDHQMVSTRISNPAMPYVGKGRWTLPLYLLKDRTLEEEMETLGVNLQRTIDHIKTHGRTPQNNPQMALADFKTAFVRKARARAKLAILRTMARIAALTRDLEHTLLLTAGHTDSELGLTAALLQQQINKLDRDRSASARTATRARYILEGETISKYWSLVNKESKPRDIVYALSAPDQIDPATGQRTVATKSIDMAEMVRDYHDHMQDDPHPTQGRVAARVTAIHNALQHVDATATSTMNADLEHNITRSEVVDAMKKAEKGKAAGLDGLPSTLR